MSGCLSVTTVDEHRIQVEHRDRDDQGGEDDEHHPLLDLDGAEVVDVLSSESVVQRAIKRQFAPMSTRAMRASAASTSTHLERTPLTSRIHAVERLCVGEVHQREAGSRPRVMPASKTPTTVNCLRRGISPAGVTCPWGEMSVTRSPTQQLFNARARPAPTTIPNRPGFNASSEPGAHALAEVGDPGFLLREDAAHETGRTAIRPKAGTALGRMARRRPRDAARRAGDLAPSARRPPGAQHLDVGGDTEDAGAHLLLQAVHHRHDDDQRPDAEGDADHRDRRIDADEAVAAPRPRVAQSDHQLVAHGGGYS